MGMKSTMDSSPYFLLKFYHSSYYKDKDFMSIFSPYETP